MEKEKSDHFNVAKIVLYGGLAAVAVLGIVAIVFSVMYGDKAGIFDSVKDILTLLLPVIGAWVGTILAYYFSRDNFQAAAESSREMFKDVISSTKEKLKSIIAKNVMINIDAVDKLILDKKESEVFLKKDIIKAILNKKNRNRLPVLDPKMKAKYMIHRSIIDRFIVESIDKDLKSDDLTLQDMLDDSEYKIMISDSFKTIKDTSNLLDAKNYIDDIEICLDIFVTKSGKADAVVIGWITNSMVTKASTI